MTNIIDAAIRGAIVGGFLMLVFVFVRYLIEVFSKKDEPKRSESYDIPINSQSTARPVTSSISTSNVNVMPKVPTSTLEATPNVMDEKNEDFEIAAKYFPELKIQLASLAVFGDEVQKLFVATILKSKEYTKVKETSEIIIDDYLTRRFGSDQKLKSLGRSYLEKKMFNKANELADTVRVLGVNISNPETINAIINNAESLGVDEIKNLYVANLNTIAGLNTTYFLAGLTDGRVVGKGLGKLDKYKIYGSFENYREATSMQPSRFTWISNKEQLDKNLILFLGILDKEGFTKKNKRDLEVSHNAQAGDSVDEIIKKNFSDPINILLNKNK